MQQVLAYWGSNLAEHPMIWTGIVFALSLLVGSFLNVVIHRLPIMLQREWRTQAEEIMREPAPDLPKGRYDLMAPRSACPKCGTRITALQNVPVLSYLLLGGRCANCRTKISPRYPIVEITTALLSAAVALKFGFTWYSAAALIFTWMLVALSVIDFDTQYLPDNLTLPLMWIGLLLSLASAASEIGLPPDPRSSIIGAAAGYLSLWSVYQIFKLITGKEGMGYGDFKLFAAFGAWLGWQMLPLIILLSAFTGAVIGLALILLRGRDRNIPIPFGPYLAAAGWIALMWGDELVTSYLQISGMR